MSCRLLVCFGLLLAQCSNPPQPVHYIDSDPPDSIPKIFAPGVISLADRLEQNLAISADGREYYFGVTDSVWDYIAILSLTTSEGNVYVDTIVKPAGILHCGEPFLSRDGNTLLFVGEYPFNIWQSSRIDGRWTPPVKLDSSINTGNLEVHPSLADNGTLYFASTRDGATGAVGEGAIYAAQRVDSKYQSPEKLRGKINIGDAGDPAVAADESFIVFAAFRDDGFGETDLYISYRLPDGSWSEPENLGANINTVAHEAGPFLSHDGKYLFFHRRERWKNPTYSDIYWVRIDFITRP